jgi:hypothetical protein
MNELSNRRDRYLKELSPWEYVALRARVRRDYAGGFIVVYDGWLVSRLEYDLLIGGQVENTSDNSARAL